MQFSIFETEDEDDDEAAIGIDSRILRNLGRAAEHLVAYDICRRGWDCSVAAESLRYDLIADVGGLRRVQVKTNYRARKYVRRPALGQAYRFGNSKAHSGAGKGLHTYVGDADVMAFVGLDRAAIVYLRPEEARADRMYFPVGRMTPEISDLSWATLLHSWGIDCP